MGLQGTQQKKNQNQLVAMFFEIIPKLFIYCLTKFHLNPFRHSHL